jgi:hypothetical protein
VSIRAAALKIKRDFPEMPGMGMYGEGDVVLRQVSRCL